MDNGKSKGKKMESRLHIAQFVENGAHNAFEMVSLVDRLFSLNKQLP